MSRQPSTGPIGDAPAAAAARYIAAIPWRYRNGGPGGLRPYLFFRRVAGDALDIVAEDDRLGDFAHGDPALAALLLKGHVGLTLVDA